MNFKKTMTYFSKSLSFSYITLPPLFGFLICLQNHSKIQSKNQQNKRYYCLPLFSQSVFIDLNWYFTQSNEPFKEKHIQHTMFVLVLSFYKTIQKYDQQKKKI